MAFNYNPGIQLDRKLFEECDAAITKNNKELNFDGLGNNFTQVIFALSKLVDLLHSNKVTIKSWMKTAEPLLIKLCLHSSSIKQLIIPVPLFKKENDDILSVYDLSSILVLSRAQLECYLTLYYFIFAPSSNDEGEFKHLLYQLSGLCNRQNYSSTLPENIAKKDAEAIEILSLRQKIANNEWYQNLIPEYKKKVDKNNPPARLVGWEDIIKSSRIKEQYFVSPWKWYSNYAHSEFIGTMQLGNYLLDGMEMKKIMYHNMEFNTMILCAAIIELLNLFPELIDSYEQSVSMKDRTYICYWSRGTLKKGLN